MARHSQARRAVLTAAALLLVSGFSTAPTAAVGCVGNRVLLVHDFATTAASMAGLEKRLEASGRCVEARTYGSYPNGLPLGGMQSLEYSADQLATWIRATAAGRGKVDVVAHGAGSLAVVRALDDARAARRPLPVATLVSLGGLWSGTNVAFLGDLDLLSRQAGSYDAVLAIERLLLDRICAVCREVIANSDFLTELSADGVLVPGVRQVNVVTRYDELVVPYTSGLYAGMVNLVLQDRAPGALVDHFGLPGAVVVADLVESELGR